MKPIPMRVDAFQAQDGALFKTEEAAIKHNDVRHNQKIIDLANRRIQQVLISTESIITIDHANIIINIGRQTQFFSHRSILKVATILQKSLTELEQGE